MKIIADLWRYADCTYKEPSILPFTPPSAIRKYTPIFRWLDFALISHEEKRIVVAVRGTDSADGNWRAWIDNMRALDRINDSLDPGIHDGFGAAARSFFDVVADEIAAYVQQGKPLYFCGHSRGGAIAVVMAYYTIKHRLATKCSCVTYGAPASGSKAFRNEFNLLPIDCTMVSTTYDIGPLLPPKQAGFRHVGKAYELRTNPLVPFPAVPPLRLARGIRDHLPATYRRLLSGQ